MDKGIYTALSGGIAKSHELELIANNLANVNTPAFKRDNATFNEYLSELRRPDSVEGLKRQITAETLLDGRPAGDKSFVEVDGIYTDFRPGPMQRTSRALDLGLEGKGFFEVLTPAGVRYTRQGNFSMAADGTLVTVSGEPVLGTGEAGAPPEGRIIRLTQEPAQISPDGRIRQGDRVVATVSLVEFHENQWLEKSGNSFYRNTDERNLVPGFASGSKIHQGFLEGSNVNPVHEMTRLIEATRAYESHMQAIKTYQEIDGRTVNDIISR